jgi:cardiolipin synthase C
VIAFILSALVCLALAGLAMRFIYRPQRLARAPRVVALAPPENCTLAKRLGHIRLQRKGLTGIHIIDDGIEAFAVRRGLIRSAESSIDAQYYMWRGDLTGQLLMGEILEAAERGVKVRLLIDDNPTLGTDDILLAAASHKNVELRLFNPFMLRWPRWPSFLFDMKRVNRRMHNKSLTVDGTASIVGGRNIGDEYFNAHADMSFADMDVLAVGSVVADVATSFDDYWNSESAYPLHSIIKPASRDYAAALREALEKLAQDERAIGYAKHVEKSPLLQSAEPPEFEWVPVELVVDNPAKGKGQIARRNLLVTGLQRRLGEVQQSVDVATAYFVPGRIGMQYLSRLARAGKTVRVLTNSLASNDVVPVHAGYARYRKRLLRRGVALHELRASNATTGLPRRGKSRLPRFGASSSSLHAKVFVLDRARVFIGSFNFDPRSLYLNCEMGLMIDSENLGKRIAQQMDRLIATGTYTPFLESAGRLSWRDIDAKVYRVEPGSTAKQRVMAWVISWLPVEWLL